MMGVTDILLLDLWSILSSQRLAYESLSVEGLNKSIDHRPLTHIQSMGQVFGQQFSRISKGKMRWPTIHPTYGSWSNQQILGVLRR